MSDDVQRMLDTGDIVDFRAHIKAAKDEDLMSLWLRANKAKLQNFADAAFEELRRRGMIR